MMAHGSPNDPNITVMMKEDTQEEGQGNADATVMFIEREDGKVEYPSIGQVTAANEEAAPGDDKN